MSAPSSSTPPKIFDRERIAAHLSRRNAADDFVATLVVEDLADRLMPITRRFERALVMGPDAATLPSGGRSAEGAFAFERRATILPGQDADLVDPENLELPRADYDLIVSLLDLQVVNDVPGYLSRIHQHLAPDGLFIAAVFGGASLSELREAWLQADAATSGGAFARVAPFIDVRDGGGLLQRAGFALPVADLENHVVRYSDPLALMREIKKLGASNPLAEQPARMTMPGVLAAALEAYGRIASDPDGRVRATMQIVWLSGWAPHESQQKPLKPGSAQVSLKTVLGSKA